MMCVIDVDGYQLTFIDEYLPAEHISIPSTSISCLSMPFTVALYFIINSAVPVHTRHVGVLLHVGVADKWTWHDLRVGVAQYASFDDVQFAL